MRKPLPSNPEPMNRLGITRVYGEFQALLLAWMHLGLETLQLASIQAKSIGDHLDFFIILATKPRH